MNQKQKQWKSSVPDVLPVLPQRLVVPAVGTRELSSGTSWAVLLLPMTEQSVICGSKQPFNFLLSLSWYHLCEISSKRQTSGKDRTLGEKQNFPVLHSDVISGGKDAIQAIGLYTYFHFPAIWLPLLQHVTWSLPIGKKLLLCIHTQLVEKYPPIERLLLTVTQKVSIGRL